MRGFKELPRFGEPLGSAAHAGEIQIFFVAHVVVHSWPRGFGDSMFQGTRALYGLGGKAPASAPGKAGGWGRTGGYACAAAAVAGCSITSVSRMTWCGSRMTVPSSRSSAFPSASVLAG